MKRITIILFLFINVSLFPNYSSLTKSEKTQIIWALQKAKIYNDLVKNNYTNTITSKKIKQDKTGNKFTIWYQVQFVKYPNSAPIEAITNILVIPVFVDIPKQNNLLKYIICGVGGGIIGALIAK